MYPMEERERVEYLDHETDAEEEKEAVVVATKKGANKVTPKYRVLGGKRGKEKEKKGDARKRKNRKGSSSRFECTPEKTKEESGFGWVIWLFGVSSYEKGMCGM